MAPKEIRVAHIIKVKGVSGTENHLLTLLPELTGDLKIYLILLVEPENSMSDYAGDFKKHGIEVTRIAISHHMDFSIAWKVYYLIKKIRPHIVHTHLLHADLYGTSAALMAGVKILISSKHGYDNYDSTSIFYKLNAITMRRLSKVITISNALQEKVATAEGISRSKMMTIYYGLDGKEYARNMETSRLRTDLNIPEDVCLLGTVGRLVPVKGYEVLLEALNGINFNYRLIIMGDGPLMKNLKRMCAELGLLEKVIFLGYVEDVSSKLSAIDIFVLPTLGEGFGLVLLEAMAFQLPIVSTNTMAVPEIVEHGETGLLVPPRDVKALREGIERLFNNPDERARMGRRGWEKLMKTFSVETMVTQTKQLYQDLIHDIRQGKGPVKPQSGFMI